MSEEPYGARARALISELIGAETLPAHADEAVRRVLAETASLSAELESLAAERAELAAAGLAGAAGEDDGGEALAGLAVPLVVFEATLRRNKRCLLAYAARRCDLLDDLRWAYGAAGLPPELRDKMSSAEADYYNAYGSLLQKYATTTGLDIFADMQAPKENTVEVVALRDCGRLMTTTGHRDVRVNEVHIMRKTDAEPLIRQGWMRHITDKS